MRVLSEFDLIQEKVNQIIATINKLKQDYYKRTFQEPKYLELCSKDFEFISKYIASEYAFEGTVQYILGLEVIIKD